MTTPSPITPPPELVQEWEDDFRDPPGFCDQNYGDLKVTLARAAQWGADQELEACCDWLEDVDCEDPQEAAKHLRAARRPASCCGSGDPIIDQP
jgi:hypothetical protein